MDTEDLVNFKFPIHICFGVYFSFERWDLEFELAKLLFFILTVAAWLECTCFTWFTIIVVMVCVMVRPHSPISHAIEIHWLTVTMVWLDILVSPSIRFSITIFIMVVS